MTAPETSPLAALRAEIDRLDAQIIALLAQRYALLPEVVKIKAAHNIPHRVESRVTQVIDHAVAAGEKVGLPAQLVREVYSAILAASHRYEAERLDS